MNRSPCPESGQSAVVAMDETRRMCRIVGIAILAALNAACGEAVVFDEEHAAASEIEDEGVFGPLGQQAFALINPNDQFLPYAPRFTTTGPFWGDHGTFFADVTGDTRADAIAVNNSGIFVRRATTAGTTFAAHVAWTAGGFWGDRGTFFADVTGDNKADAM